MKNKIFVKKKMVATSFLLSFIICSASTIAPAIQNSNGFTFIKSNDQLFPTYNGEDLYDIIKNQENISFEEVFILLKESLGEYKFLIYLLEKLEKDIKDSFQGIFVDDFPIFFKLAVEFIGSPDVSKQDLQIILYREVIPLLGEIQYIFREKITFDEISPKLQQMLEKASSYLDDNSDDSNTNSSSDDHGFWDKYEDALTTWTKLSLGDKSKTNSFGRWWHYFKTLTEGRTSVFAGINIGLMMAIIVTLIVYGATQIAIALVAVMLGVNLATLYHFKQGNEKYWEVKHLEIELILNIVNINGDGITGMSDNVSLVWGEIERLKDKIQYWDLGENDFTFIVQEAMDVEGYYVGKPRTSDSRFQPPLPPGGWDITIAPTKKYDKFNTSIDDIPDKKSCIKNVTLNSRPTIKIVSVNPPSTIIPVGTPVCFEVIATDDDNHRIKYLWDWDGDGDIDEEFNNTGNYYPSGEKVVICHRWNTSTDDYFKVYVWSEDIKGARSYYPDDWKLKIV